MEFDLAKVMQGGRERAIEQSRSVLAEQGLPLSAEEARALLAEHSDHLARVQRVERGAGVLPELVREFASSPCMLQRELADQLSYLQEAFYSVRDEAPLCVSDADILEALRRAFEGQAGGDAEALAEMDVREVLSLLDEHPSDAAEAELDAGNGWSEDGGVYRIADDAGRVYVFDPQAWRDDVLAPGWFGESW